MSGFLDFVVCRVQDHMRSFPRAKECNVDAREPGKIVITYTENFRACRITFEDLSVDETVTLAHTE